MKWWRFLATLRLDKTLVSRDFAAGGMIVVLIAALYAHTGNMPPLVVVESSTWFMIQMVR